MVKEAEDMECEFENGFVGVGGEWLIDCPMCDGCA